MKLMNVSEYCKSREISRSSFYRHRRAGRLRGCFVEEAGRTLVDADKADTALAAVFPNEGGQATREKFRGTEMADPDQAEFLEARARDKKYQALMREIDYKIKKGEIVPVEKVRKDAQEVIAVLSSLLSAMPAKLAPRLLQRDSLAEIQEIIEDGINDVKKAFQEIDFSKNRR